MQAKIDKFGRLLIPKNIRQHLGLRRGSTVNLTEQNRTLLIKLHEQNPPLKNMGGVLVYTCDAVGDIESAIQQDRESRDKSVGSFEE